MPTERGDLLASLSTESRSNALASLLYFLTLNARGLYKADDPSVRAWECHNEMVHVIAKQFIADADPDAAPSIGYPDEALVSTLFDAAHVRGCDSSLLYAIRRALRAASR